MDGLEGKGAGMGRTDARTSLAALALIVGLTACAPLYRNHGYAPTDSELATLAFGVDTRDSVIAAVGRPTAAGVQGESSFYYVESRFRLQGPLAPREIEREVLALSFAADGTLGAIERFGLEDGRVVPLSRRTTDLVFADSTFVRQILGNVGRVDTGALLGDE